MRPIPKINVEKVELANIIKDMCCVIQELGKSSYYKSVLYKMPNTVMVFNRPDVVYERVRVDYNYYYKTDKLRSIDLLKLCKDGTYETLKANDIRTYLKSLKSEINQLQKTKCETHTAVLITPDSGSLDNENLKLKIAKLLRDEYKPVYYHASSLGYWWQGMYCVGACKIQVFVNYYVYGRFKNQLKSVKIYRIDTYHVRPITDRNEVTQLFNELNMAESISA